MLTILRTVVTRLSKWPVVICATVVFGLFIAVFLPAQKKSAEAYSHGVGSVDLSFIASPSEIYKIAEAYGKEGRSRYIRDRLTFDFVWPLVYTLFYASFIGFCLLHVHGEKKLVYLLTGSSFVPLFLDYVENVLAVAIMASYPAPLPCVPWVLVFVTPFKWASVSIVSLVWLYGILTFLIKVIKRRIA